MIRPSTGIAIVDSVIEFHRFIPICRSGTVVEVVVTSGLGRKFRVRITYAGSQIEIRFEWNTNAIVEIIAWRESHSSVVRLAQVFYSLWFSNRLILSCDMVWNKIYYDFQSHFMRPLYKNLKFFHAFGYIFGQIRVYVIIIGYGIRRAGVALYDGRMLVGNAT